jgi:hypothetical protein
LVQNKFCHVSNSIMRASESGWVSPVCTEN